ncbi:AsmA-like C-terminal region-containing protein [Elioraea rosea]|uniref:AsmA-like C-terminal region-containing protein n=1 Tax=Elioraea rosea TaxID=2492390 RepID=UPI0011861ED8|nr:AsmA-like C-terminal region-containing protein [Elioraea rosea]
MIRASGRLLRWIGALVLMLAVAGTLGVGALAWRLSQGPLAIDALARIMERHANSDDRGMRVTIGSAALVWEGFGGGIDRPLDVRVTDVHLYDANAVEILALPEGEVSLGLRALLLGRFEPRAIALAGLRITLTRGSDGQFAFELDARRHEASPTPAPEGGNDVALLSELGLVPVGQGEASPRFAALRQVVVRDAEIVVADRQLGASWTIPDAQLAIRRSTAPGGASLVLTASGHAIAGAARIPLRVSARLEPDGRAEGELSFDSVEPAAIAAALPRLADIAGIAAPLSGTIGASRAPDGTITSARLRAALGAGAVTLPGAATLPVTSAAIAARYTPSSITIEEARLTVPGSHGPSPTATLTGSATPEQGGGWRAEARITLDAIAAADLRQLWPEGVGRNERRWIVENITAGTARNLDARIAATIPPTLDTLVPVTVDGTLQGDALTVHYLRPMPPVEGVAARLRLGLSTIDIETQGGRLGAITVPEGKVRLFDLDASPNRAEVSLRIDSTIPDALALLAHPKLDLLSRRGAPPPGITGAGEIALTVAFPLLDALSIDDLDVTAKARAQDVRVPAILAGRDFERGRAELAADRNGLTLSGTGQFGPINADVGGMMDFRSGPASQVVEKFTLRVPPQEGIAGLFGLDTAPWVTGRAALDATLETRRGGQGLATVKADLAQSRLAVTELGVEKPAGQPGTAEGRVTLANGRLTGAELTRLEAGEIRGNARFVIARDGRLERIEVPDLRLGGSRLSGSVALPQRGSAYAVTLRAPVLDISRRGPDAAVTPDAADAAASQPNVGIDAVIDRLVIKPGHELADVRGTGVYARGMIARADLSARAGERGTMRAQVTPEGAKRTLLLTADDAGAFLNAFDVLHTMAGGTLTVRGTYDDTRAGRPLTGEAELLDFRMREAPGAARVLQAMTLYGVLDLARGPGVAFTRAVSSFSLTDELFELRDARAYGASLGFTAKGRVERKAERLDLEGTIVPAYFFNSLLGHIPLIGRIFSPEQGGGLFAATYRVRGPLADPEVSVNPLAALTPGFLRGLFGSFEGSGQPPPAAQPSGDVPEHQRGG